MSIANKTVVLTDHTKWQLTSLSLFAGFDDVDVIITDSGISPEDVEATREVARNLIIAD